MIIDYDQIAKLLDSNLEVKIRQEQLGASKIKVASVGSTFIPDVSLYAKTENEKGDKISEAPAFGIYASLNVFNGFRDLESSNISNLNYQSASLILKKANNEEMFKAKKFYFEGLKILEDIKILSEHEKINKNNRDLILKKVVSGLSPKSEELIFKKIDLTLREQRVKEDNALKVIYSNLKLIFAIDKNEKIELAGSLDISKFEYKIPNKRLDLAILESSESILNSEKKMSSLWRMPKVNLYAEKSFTSKVNGEFLEKDEAQQLLGLKVTLPILGEKNVDSVESQVKSIEARAAMLKTKNQIREWESSEEIISVELEHLRSMIEISKSKVDLSKEIMEKTYTEFRLGLKEALSLNEAAEDYLEARKDLIDHKVEYILNIEAAKINSID
jgi:outer membrane protein TolC